MSAGCPIVTFDLHDRALYTWRNLGVRGCTLVHVDAHHDAAVAPEGAPVDIGNFVQAALQSGVISRVHWVPPEPLWRTASGRRFVERQLRRIGEARITAGPFDSLRPADGPVLLDIDVDYFALPDPRHKGSGELPWSWPEAFVSAWQRSGISPLAITIASSVTGGFTPVLWKHLADEIAARLAGSAGPGRLDCFGRVREAAVARREGRLDAAIAGCRAAIALQPAEAAAHYHLARYLFDAGQIDEARAAFARTRALDSSYRTPFGTTAPSHLRHGRWAAARAACESALCLDPGDPYAAYGLGLIALREGRPAEARQRLDAAVAADPESIEGWRALGEALASAGEPRLAIRAYDRALSLALRGAVPASGPWFGSNTEGRVIGYLHGRDHAAVGALQERIGDLDAALVSLAIAAAVEPRRWRLRWRRARLYARKRQWQRSLGALTRFHVRI